MNAPQAGRSGDEESRLSTVEGRQSLNTGRRWDNVTDRLAIPYPGYLRTIAERTAVMWLLVRVFLALALWLSGLEFAEAVLTPTLGIPALLVWLDRRSGDELILQANLGASELWLTGGSLALVLLLDLLAHLLLTS